jgi:hypothetical protein
MVGAADLVEVDLGEAFAADSAGAVSAGDIAEDFEVETWAGGTAATVVVFINRARGPLIPRLRLPHTFQQHPCPRE